MDLETFGSALRDIDQNSVILIVILSACASMLIREILQTTTLFALASFPVMLGASLSGVAIASICAIYFGREKAVNVVITAVGGMVALFIVGAIVYCIAARLSAHSVTKPYSPRRPTRPQHETGRD